MFSVAESPLHLRFRCRKKQFAAQIPPSAAIVDRPRVAGARNTEILPPPKRGGYNIKQVPTLPLNTELNSVL